MTTLSVPISPGQAEFIDSLVKNKKASNKADAVRKAIDLLAEEELLASVMRAEQELKEGKVLYGDPRKLLKRFSKYD
jgi:Arc/MetJ-type ribon-helix-helix transcriptional regulator